MFSASSLATGNLGRICRPSFHCGLFQKLGSISTRQTCPTHSQRVHTLDSIEPVDVAFIKIDPLAPAYPSSAIKPPVIIYHGLFGSKENWRSLSKLISIATGRPVYSLDVRNHGDSPHSDRFDFPAMAADVRHLMKNREKLKKAVLLGHSLGGRAMYQLSVFNVSSQSIQPMVDILIGEINFIAGIGGKVDRR